MYCCTAHYSLYICSMDHTHQSSFLLWLQHQTCFYLLEQKGQHHSQLSCFFCNLFTGPIRYEHLPWFQSSASSPPGLQLFPCQRCLSGDLHFEVFWPCTSFFYWSQVGGYMCVCPCGKVGQCLSKD